MSTWTCTRSSTSTSTSQRHLVFSSPDGLTAAKTDRIGTRIARSAVDRRARQAASVRYIGPAANAASIADATAGAVVFPLRDIAAQVEDVSTRRPTLGG